MKRSFLAYLATLIFLFSIFYLIDRFDVSYKSRHPTLNSNSVTPDLHLNNTRHYVRDHSLEHSLYHLDQAIQSIRRIQQDVDLNSSQDLDEAVSQLETVYDEIYRDSLQSEDMNAAFQKTLNALALAELRVSERYAESNHQGLARVGLKYAQMHLRNAFSYSDPELRGHERELYREIDELLHDETVPTVILVEKIDKLIDELNLIVENSD